MDWADLESVLLVAHEVGAIEAINNLLIDYNYEMIANVTEESDVLYS